MIKVKVLERFGDKYNFSIKYEVGTIVEFDSERATEMINRGLVEVLETPIVKEVKKVEVLENFDNEVNLDANWKAVINRLEKLTDANQLNEYKRLEMERKNPRPSVLDAIDRIIESL